MPIDFESLRDPHGNPYRPQTFDEAVDFLFDSLDQSERDYIRQNGARQMHFGFGMTLRNEWDLWETRGPEPLVRDTIKRFNCHPGDDISDQILKALEERVGYAGARAANGAGVQACGSDAHGSSNLSPRATFVQRLLKVFGR